MQYMYDFDTHEHFIQKTNCFVVCRVPNVTICSYMSNTCRNLLLINCALRANKIEKEYVHPIYQLYDHKVGHISNL